MAFFSNLDRWHLEILKFYLKIERRKYGRRINKGRIWNGSKKIKG